MRHFFVLHFRDYTLDLVMDQNGKLVRNEGLSFGQLSRRGLRPASGFDVGQQYLE